jgi:hypothetical protein
MPSRHQAGDCGDYDTPAEKYLREKNMRTVLALVDGIRREERAREWLGAANAVGVHEKVHEEIVGKVRELSD